MTERKMGLLRPVFASPPPTGTYRGVMTVMLTKALK